MKNPQSIDHGVPEDSSVLTGWRELRERLDPRSETNGAVRRLLRSVPQGMHGTVQDLPLGANLTLSLRFGDQRRPAFVARVQDELQQWRRRYARAGIQGIEGQITFRYEELPLEARIARVHQRVSGALLQGRRRDILLSQAVPTCDDQITEHLRQGDTLVDEAVRYYIARFAEDRRFSFHFSREAMQNEEAVLQARRLKDWLRKLDERIRMFLFGDF